VAKHGFLLKPARKLPVNFSDFGRNNYTLTQPFEKKHSVRVCCAAKILIFLHILMFIFFFLLHFCNDLGIMTSVVEGVYTARQLALPHNADYVAFFFCLYDKPQPFQLAAVFFSG